MFVKLYKNGKTIKVPSGSVEQYVKAGWERSLDATSKEEHTKKVTIEKESEKDIEDDDSWNDEDWNDEESEEDEKPISEMNNAELKAYASKHKIDISGLNSNKLIREAISKANR